MVAWKRRMTMKTDNELYLVVAAKHFDDILAGRKTKEWRVITPFWKKRIYDRRPKTVRFQRGYSKEQARFKIHRITWANNEYEEYPLRPVVPHGFIPVYFTIWIGDRLS